MNSTPHHDRHTVLRIIDANLNRATEALRVTEELARFGLDSSYLTGQLKDVRHSLTSAFAGWHAAMVQIRDVLTDVGTARSIPSETSRSDVTDVAGANFSRLKQSLRCLEEFGKTIDAPAAAQVEQIRYRVYSLEKALLGAARSRIQFDDLQLYVLVDGDLSVERFRERIKSLIAAQVNIVQLRDKTLSDRDLLQRANVLTDLTRSTDVLSIINNRADVAIACHADGVHLGQDDLTVAAARRIVGDRLLVGVSTHSIEQARAAVLDGVDYIGVGPTFPSQTKNFDDFPGLDLLIAVASEISLPAFAIGGVTLDKLSDVVATGVHRIAIQHALSDLDSIPEIAQHFRERLALAANRPSVSSL
jgi:thiamine-phosphate pyrophosphorylase